MYRTSYRRVCVCAEGLCARVCEIVPGFTQNQHIALLAQKLLLSFRLGGRSFICFGPPDILSDTRNIEKKPSLDQGDSNPAVAGHKVYGGLMADSTRRFPRPPPPG